MNKIIAKELLNIAHLLIAFEFNTKDELNKYLKDHPDADKSKHWVKRPKVMDKFRWDKDPSIINFSRKLRDYDKIEVKLPPDVKTCSKEKLQGYLDKIEDKLEYYSNIMNKHRVNLDHSPDVKKRFDSLLDRFKMSHYKLTKIMRSRNL